MVERLVANEKVEGSSPFARSMKIWILFIKKNIFNNIYLDKKRVNNFPRYIKLLSKGESKISELKSKNRIKETINKIIF